jgi:hypothetical protein
MGILYGVCLVVLGCLAVPHLVVSKFADAKRILDKLVPFQGWIGFLAGLFGLYEITWMLSSLSYLGDGVKGIVHVAIIAAAVVCQIALGFILGIGIVKHFVSDAQAQAKLDQLLDRVLPHRTVLGLLAIADGFAVVAVTLVPSILQ